ncbi:MAG: hypothetical protein ACI9TY_001338 [Alphaproteobacteria bacterium]|jgi:hypothetical protein
MKILVVTLLLSFTWVQAYASSYSTCIVMGVVEDVYYNKIHFRPLKSTSTVEIYDPKYDNCAQMNETVIALYDNGDEAANEPCQLKIIADFKKNKIRNRWKDNVQKGDMITFDYTFYQSMTPSGGMCAKDWAIQEHVPINPHSR